MLTNFIEDIHMNWSVVGEPTLVEINNFFDKKTVKMGNESSQMSRNNIVFNDQPVEKTLSSCLLYDAEQNNIQITVHQETSKDKISYFQNSTPLDRNSKVIWLIVFFIDYQRD